MRGPSKLTKLVGACLALTTGCKTFAHRDIVPPEPDVSAHEEVSTPVQIAVRETTSRPA